MSTRGAYGFRIDGEDKITYNHDNSSPAGLGLRIVQWTATHSLADLRTLARSLRLVSEETGLRPSLARTAYLPKTANLPSDPPHSEWYTLLRDFQGHPEAWDDGLRYCIDDAAFLEDSLSCEWAYVIDCDAATFEVYRGWNQDPTAQATRYAIATSENGYYACRLIATFALQALPNAETFLQTLAPFERESLSH